MAAKATSRRSLGELARPGWEAAVRNRRPFLAIQGLAIAAAAAYSLYPPLQAELASVAEFKRQAGLPFSAVSTALAGVVLPEAARRVTRTKASSAADLLFQAALYALLGTTVDLLYRGLALWLGSRATFVIVLEKVLVDQLLYSPFVSMPFSTLVFLWRDRKFGFAATGVSIRDGQFARRYTPLLVTCWAFWIPVLAAVYAMPSNLQFMLFLCAQGAWSLLLVAVAAHGGVEAV